MGPLLDTLSNFELVHVGSGYLQNESSALVLGDLGVRFVDTQQEGSSLWSLNRPNSPPTFHAYTITIRRNATCARPFYGSVWFSFNIIPGVKV